MSGPGSGAVAGAVAVGPVGQPLGDPRRLPDSLTGLFLWQNIFGVWPADGVVSAELRGRLHDYREGDPRSGRQDVVERPDTGFERAVHGWLDAVLDGPVATELTELVTQLEPHAHNDALGQKLLSLTVPGIPDVYQGTELWEDSLVDPDNRRPVDYAERLTELDRLAHPKIRVVAAALHARRDRPTPSCTAAISRCWRPVRPRSTSWRSYAVTTSWWR